MFSKSLTKHFMSFSSGFTERHAKLDADTLLDFAIHRSQNETQRRKSTRVKTTLVHSAMSRGKVMQSAWPPLSSYFTEAVATIRVRELSDNLVPLLLTFLSVSFKLLSELILSSVKIIKKQDV
jgi:hypothetical protein